MASSLADETFPRAQHVRIAMVENEHRLRQAARNVKRYLQSMGVNTPAQSKAI